MPSRIRMAISDKLVAAAMKNLEKLLISKGLNPEGMISKFDFDGDGEINIDEFDIGLEELTGSRAPRSYLQPIFSAIDQDGSGKLSSNELMALLGIENKTMISSSSLVISNHVKEKYNGEYRLQSTKINGKNWYLNSNGCRLYFYNANDGGAPSWSLDDREQDGSNDWYGGGWTRVPADGNIPVGTRRFVGAGKITIQDNEVSPENDASEDSEDKESDMVSMVENWSLELGQMLENPESEEAIDSIKLSMDEKFESEVSQLPLVTRAPARAIWKIKSDAVVTIAKTKFSNDNAKIIAGLGIAGAAIGALSTIDVESKKEENAMGSKSETDMPISENEETLESSDSWPESNRVEVPDRLETVSQESSEHWAETHDVEIPDRVELPERVSVSETLSKPFTDENTSDTNISESEATSISLEEIIIQMNEARFLNEQKELITGFKGSLFELSFRVNTIDRTFGIGILDEYRRGNTLHVTSGIYDIEVRMVNDYDTSKILTGTEMSLQVSVDSWNGIRKRLIVNSI
ncbi:MAG: hypothetical protein CMA57_02050 [Euryarchaeota archaeon]|nr:hypothetical protein [Euryarchaeota archaeon]